MRKKLLFLIALSYSVNTYAQEAPPFEQFWEHLAGHCGKAYAGKVVTEPVPKDFHNKE